MELTSFVVLFVSWVIWHVDPMLIGASMTGLMIVLGLLIMVALNESVLAKVSLARFNCCVSIILTLVSGVEFCLV